MSLPRTAESCFRREVSGHHYFRDLPADSADNIIADDPNAFDERQTPVRVAEPPQHPQDQPSPTVPDQHVLPRYAASEEIGNDTGRSSIDGFRVLRQGTSNVRSSK